MSDPATLPACRACFVVLVRGGRTSLARVERRGRQVACTWVDAGEARVRRELDRGAPVVSCLSSRETLTRWLTVPLGALRKARKVIPSLLDIQLPFPLEECVYAVLRFEPSAPGESRALAVAARVSDVEARLAAVKAAGFDPAVFDQEGVALWTQAAAEHPADTLPWRVVVHLDDDGGTLVIGRQGEYLSAHALRIVDGAQIARLVRACREERGGSLPAAAGPGEAPEGVEWIWAGPGSRSIAAAALRAQLAAEWPGSVVVAEEPDGFLLRALGTRALLPGPLRCNLRTGVLAHPLLLRRSRRRFLAASLAVLVSGLLLVGSAVGLRVAMAARSAQVEAAASALADRLAGFHVTARGAQGDRVVADAVERRKAQLEPFRRAFDPSLAVTVSAIIRQAAVQGLTFDTLSMNEQGIEIAGVARDWRPCESLRSVLAVRGYSVRLDRESPPEAAEARFRIRSADRLPAGAKP